MSPKLGEQRCLTAKKDGLKCAKTTRGLSVRAEAKTMTQISRNCCSRPNDAPTSNDHETIDRYEHCLHWNAWQNTDF